MTTTLTVKTSADDVRQLLKERKPKHGTLSHLRSMRYEAGLSLKDAAQFIGVTPTTLIFWEQGKHTPQPQYWPALRELREILDEALSAGGGSGDGDA